MLAAARRLSEKFELIDSIKILDEDDRQGTRNRAVDAFLRVFDAYCDL